MRELELDIGNGFPCVCGFASSFLDCLSVAAGAGGDIRHGRGAAKKEGTGERELIIMMPCPVARALSALLLLLLLPPSSCRHQ
jgi:hypothetical protein